MTVATLKDIIADIIDQNYVIRNEYGEDPSVENPEQLADLIVKRIQEDYLISERGTGRDIISTANSWQGQVDRQGGSFSDQEILDSYTWR